ncbi:uncharacterized protein LOC130716584 isoform X2 [Lotus japonicus]|uniref:uncharacterized protein LOC130716584 isoform X2 n=1 Tax=Lotus japonicus TaxID=34305 RepID=UPI00258C4215|nr:uncharacterized protein LOC130716584 isoform X2 [Lotus japonicus]
MKPHFPNRLQVHVQLWTRQITLQTAARKVPKKLQINQSQLLKALMQVQCKEVVIEEGLVLAKGHPLSIISMNSKYHHHDSTLGYYFNFSCEYL